MLKITTLACHRDIEMSLVSLNSFIVNNKEDFQIHIYQDGSLSSEDMALLNALPHTTIQDKVQIDRAVEHALKEKFPFCWKWRNKTFFNIKLFDMAIMENSDFVYFDSDVFFIRPFKGFDRTHFGGESLILMEDIEDAYSFNFIDRYIYPGIHLPRKINAGFYYLKQGALDLDVLEWFFKKYDVLLQKDEYYRVLMIDQTAWAFLASKIDGKIWSSTQSIIPTSYEDIHEKIIAVHLIKRLVDFPIVYEKVKDLIHRPEKNIFTINTQNLAYNNFFGAGYNRIKVKLAHKQ